MFVKVKQTLDSLFWQLNNPLNAPKRSTLHIPRGHGFLTFFVLASQWVPNTFFWKEATHAQPKTPILFIFQCTMKADKGMELAIISIEQIKAFSLFLLCNTSAAPQRSSKTSIAKQKLCPEMPSDVHSAATQVRPKPNMTNPTYSKSSWVWSMRVWIRLG